MISSIAPATLKRWLHDGQEIALLDVREQGQFGEAHLFYGVPLPYSQLESRIALLVPRRNVRLVVYDDGADEDGVATRAAKQLVALGYDQVHVLAGGTSAWKAAGMTLFAGVNLPSKTFGELAEGVYHTPRISATELNAMLANKEPVAVLDGRPFSEFQKMNIPQAICCPNGELAYRVSKLVPDESMPIVINCAGRTRSIIGAQTLINLGLPNPVYALENGTQGWYLADQVLEHGGSRRYGANSAGGELKESAEALARRFNVSFVDAHQVLAWNADPDRSLFLCDVRTPEEFAAGSLRGAQHAPGGQLIQATDQYVGVRGARIVLVDDEGVRAPTVASWLSQLGHDVSVLSGGLASGLALPERPHAAPPRLATIDASSLRDRLEGPSGGDVAVIDLRAGMRFRAGHIAQARWSIRPRLKALAGSVPPDQQLVLVSDEPQQTAWIAATELSEISRPPQLLEGGMNGWTSMGFSIEATPDQPNDADCIDYLFFVHDRHDGNKAAARQYLEWETGLVAQLDEQELAGFRLPAPAMK